MAKRERNDAIVKVIDTVQLANGTFLGPYEGMTDTFIGSFTSCRRDLLGPTQRLGDVSVLVIESTVSITDLNSVNTFVEGGELLFKEFWQGNDKLLCLATRITSPSGYARVGVTYMKSVAIVRARSGGTRLGTVSTVGQLFPYDHTYRIETLERDGVVAYYQVQFGDLVQVTNFDFLTLFGFQGVANSYQLTVFYELVANPTPGIRMRTRIRSLADTAIVDKVNTMLFTSQTVSSTSMSFKTCTFRTSLLLTNRTDLYDTYGETLLWVGKEIWQLSDRFSSNTPTPPTSIASRADLISDTPFTFSTPYNFRFQNIIMDANYFDVSFKNVACDMDALGIISKQVTSMNGTTITDANSTDTTTAWEWIGTDTNTSNGEPVPFRLFTTTNGSSSDDDENPPVSPPLSPTPEKGQLVVVIPDETNPSGLAEPDPLHAVIGVNVTTSSLNPAPKPLASARIEFVSLPPDGNVLPSLTYSGNNDTDIWAYYSNVTFETNVQITGLDALGNDITEPLQVIVPEPTLTPKATFFTNDVNVNATTFVVEIKRKQTGRFTIMTFGDEDFTAYLSIALESNGNINISDGTNSYVRASIYAPSDAWREVDKIHVVSLSLQNGRFTEYTVFTDTTILELGFDPSTNGVKQRVPSNPGQVFGGSISYTLDFAFSPSIKYCDITPNGKHLLGNVIIVQQGSTFTDTELRAEPISAISFLYMHRWATKKGFTLDQPGNQLIRMHFDDRSSGTRADGIDVTEFRSRQEALLSQLQQGTASEDPMDVDEAYENEHEEKHADEEDC